MTKARYTNWILGNLYIDHIARGRIVKDAGSILISKQELDLHMTVSAADICEVRFGQPPDGITAEHERKLRSRKKACSTQSNEEIWRDMYPNLQVNSPLLQIWAEQ